MQRVVWENGADFVFVNGDCRYWVRQLADPPGDGTPWLTNAEQLLGPTYTGVLTAELAHQLENDLSFGAWDELDHVAFRSGGADLPTIQMFGGGQIFSCVGRDCGNQPTPRTLVQRAQQWSINLRSQGAPLDGPMRGIVMRLEPRPGLPPEGDPIPLDSSAFLENAVSEVDAASLGYGGYPLVPGGELATWRALRASFVARDAWWFHLTVADAAGTVYYVNVRDVLPFEGDDGIVPSPVGP